MAANDTIDTLIFPKPPSQVKVQSIEDANTVFEDLARYNRDVMRYNDDLYNILHSGALVRSFQVEELSADQIIAGVISVDQVYLLDDKFELNGVLQQIIVKDAQGTPVTRVEIGKFGAGSDYGIKIRNAAGTVVFQATSTTSINGAVITNATIDGAALTDTTLDGVKLKNTTVTNSKVASDISATKVTAGTLVCSSTSVAISVTSGGQVILSNGSDIIFKASASGNNSVCSFRTSGNVEKGYIYLNPTTSQFGLASDGYDLHILANNSDMTITAGGAIMISAVGSGGDMEIYSDSGNVKMNASDLGDVTVNTAGNILLRPASVATISGDFRATADNTYDLGLSSFKWANAWIKVDHVGDIEFDNGWRLTEPDKVYEGMQPESGLLIMNDKWELMAVFDRQGNLFVRGFVAPLHEFRPVNVERREAPADPEAKENHGRKETRSLN